MFPIRDVNPSEKRPIVVMTLVAVNLVIFLYQVFLPKAALFKLVYLFGIVPQRYTHPEWAVHVGFPDTYLPFLSHMFLHGGWFHVLGNLWILWVFGDNVEDRMGHLRFLIFYLLCGVGAGVFHVWTDADSMTPVVGASGAIAGVLGAYFLLFPMARVVCVIPILFYPVFIEVYAFVFLLFWALIQVFSGAASLLERGQAGGIAWWAHVGGFIAGMALCGLFAKRRRPPARRPRYTHNSDDN